MNRTLLFPLALTMVLMCLPTDYAKAGGGSGHSRGGGGVHGRSMGHGHGFGGGHGFGAFYDDDSDFADLYRELYNNLPYFALHPPVYYSYPVPRTYGYSPFAYPPHVMTPEVAGPSAALEIRNPYVTQEESADAETDRAASTNEPEPLMVTNPFVAPSRSVAQH